MLSLPFSSFAQEKLSRRDSILNIVKIKQLQSLRSQLKDKVALEERKRNRVIEGVATETLEKINRRQDSLCLELRSRLVGVLLEIKEIAGTGITEEVADRYHVTTHARTEADEPAVAPEGGPAAARTEADGKK